MTEQRNQVLTRTRWVNFLCVVDTCASVVFGGVTLWLAALDVPLPDFFIPAVWLWLAGIPVGAQASAVIASALTEPQRRLWNSVGPRHGSQILGTFALLVTSALLFAHGADAVAFAAEFLCLARLKNARGEFEPRNKWRARLTPQSAERWWSVKYEHYLLPIGAFWLVFGDPAPWLETMTVSALWILSIWTLVGALIEAGSSVIGNWWRRRSWATMHDARFRSRFPGKEVPRPESDYPPEIERHFVTRLLKWPYRAAVLVASWVLAANGRPELGAVYLASVLCGIAWGVVDRRKYFGPSAHVDAVARMIYDILWRPLKVVGTIFLVVLVPSLTIPILPLLLIYVLLQEWLAPFRRRIRMADAADGAFVCHAFERPEGFVYFLYSSPRQFRYFMAPDSVLPLSGLPIVARNWQRDVMPLRIELGIKEFEKMPEGVLLKHAGFDTWHDGLPLAVIVTPTGAPAAMNFAGAYRCRKANPGLLATAELGFANAVSELRRKGRLPRGVAA